MPLRQSEGSAGTAASDGQKSASRRLSGRRIGPMLTGRHVEFVHENENCSWCAGSRSSCATSHRDEPCFQRAARTFAASFTASSGGLWTISAGAVSGVLRRRIGVCRRPDPRRPCKRLKASSNLASRSGLCAIRHSPDADLDTYATPRRPVTKCRISEITATTSRM